MKIFDYNNYHFIGIGGIGISAIARMLKIQRKNVTGSDGSSSEITKDLEKIGIPVSIGQKAENIPADTEVVIYTIAIPETNPELIEAKKIKEERNLIIATYPEALGELSKVKKTIAVSGTHGKTTTTAMIGHILTEAGLDPTIIVGSKMLSGDAKECSNFYAGRGEYLVVEACEYKRSFLNLHPTILVILNIEQDHLDYYKDLDDIRSAFKELKKKVIASGIIITETEYSNISSNLELLVPGEHNIKNAQAAITASTAAGVSEEQAREALKTFRGTWRRLEYKGEKSNTIFYDDYAHHPTEIKASLSALKEKYPDRKLICVFEPHQYSRTKLLFHEFVDSLKLANHVFITPIFLSRETPDPTVSHTLLANAVSKFIPTEPIENPAELKTKLAELKNEKLCIVLMGAGDIYKWTEELIGSIN